MFNKLYIVIIFLVSLVATIVFDTFPRSTKSELEKRTLAAFPSFSVDKLLSGDFTKEVSLWFSDSEPFRDEIMAFSMNVKKLEALKTDDDNVSFIAADKDVELADEQADVEDVDNDNRKIEKYENHITANAEAKIARYGIVIVGKGKNVRALMGFQGNAKLTRAYAGMVNKYQKAFGEGT